MSPSDLNKLTLKQLRTIRTASFTLEWALALEDATPAVKRDAALLMVAVNHAIVVLENTELTKLRDQLVANEAGLTQGAADCEKALKKLGRVKAVIAGISAFVGIAAQIAKLAV